MPCVLAAHPGAVSNGAIGRPALRRRHGREAHGQGVFMLPALRAACNGAGGGGMHKSANPCGSWQGCGCTPLP